MNTKIKGFCFALAIVFCLAGAPFSDIQVQAYDSNKPLDTASRVTAAVNAMNSRDLDEVDWIAAAVRSLSWTEQKRLSSSTIRKLDNAYATGHGYSQTLRVYEGNVTSNRIPQNGASVMGATVAAAGDAYVSLVQEKPSSSSVQLQFSTSFSGSLWSPVIYSLSRPANIKTNYDYYVKDASGNKLDLSVTSSYISFLAPDPVSTFRIYRGSKNSSSDVDDPYVVTAFWEDVIDAIDTARSGDRVRISIGTRTSMPAEVLRTLRGRSVTLSLRQSSGNTVVIYGRDLPVIPVSRDYYTISTLKRLYDHTSSSKASSSRASSSSRPIDPPVPVVPPVSSVAPPKPVVQQPINRWPPVTSVETSSTTLSEPQAAPSLEEEESRPDIEIEAIEESAPEEPSARPEQEEKPAVVASSATPSFVLFIVLCIVASATGASLLTLLISRRDKK